jgi:hypothetical protein
MKQECGVLLEAPFTSRRLRAILTRPARFCGHPASMTYLLSADFGSSIVTKARMASEL